MDCDMCGAELVEVTFCDKCTSQEEVADKMNMRNLNAEERQLIIDLRVVPTHLHPHVFRLIHALKTSDLLPKVH